MFAVGSYECLEEIGRGGMGVVYRGRAPDGGEVAVKIFARNDARGAAMFDRERRLLALLGEEQGFVPLLDAGSAPRGAYIVMPFIAGGTLRDKLRLGPMPADEVAALGFRLATALGAAHARGIVHRDLKPENVLFTASGRPLVADLGLAKHWRRDLDGASHTVSISRAGGRLGTAGYMAPEQIDDAKSVGPAADVFGLGATLYECLAGRPAYDGDSLVELLAKIKSEAREPIRSVVPETPAWLAEVVERALATDLSRRFGDGAELARALERDGSASGLPLGVKLLCAVAIACVFASGALARFVVRRPPRRGVAVVSSRAPVVAPGWPGGAPPPALPPAIAALPVRGGRIVRAFGTAGDPHRGFVRAAAFSGPRWAITASVEKTVALWDLEHPGAAVETRHGVEVVAVSDDGSIAIVKSDGYFVHEWRRGASGARPDIGAGAARPLEAPKKRAMNVSISRDRTRAIFETSDGVALVDLESGRTLVSCPGGRENRAVLAPDAARIAFIEGSGIKVFEVATGATVTISCRSTAVGFSADGTRILCGDSNGGLSIVDARTGTLLASHTAANARVAAVAVSPDGTRILVAAADGGLQVHRAGDASLVNRIPVCRGDWWTIAFDETGRRALASSGDGTILVVELETGQLQRRLGRAWAPAASLGTPPDGARLLGGLRDGGVVAWDSRTGAETTVLDGRGGVLTPCPAFSPDALAAVTDVAPEGLVLVDIASGRPLLPLPTRRDGDWVSSAAVSSGARSVAFATWAVPGALVIDDAGRERARLAAERPPCSLAIADDGARLAAGGDDGIVTIWSVERQVVVRSLEAHRKGDLWYAVAAVALSSNGRRVLSGAYDCAARIFDVDSGLLLFAVEFADEVNGVAFAPRDELALVAAGARAVVFEVATGRVRVELDVGPIDEKCRACAFARTGQSFYVALAGGQVLEVELAR